MKRQTPNQPARQAPSDAGNHTDCPIEDRDEWHEGDPLWDLLNQASPTKPDAFFARNVVRSSRQLQPTTLRSRIFAFLGSRPIALAGTACTFALIGYFTWQSQSTPMKPTTTQTPTIAEVTPPKEDLTPHFSDLIIEETLIAAADNPSDFTRDEVVTMLGL